MKNAPAPLAFLTGCGRSGTTILIAILGQHPGITALNDEFAVWLDPFPFTDIWGRTTSEEGGRIVLDERDAARASAEQRAKFFAGIEARRASRAVVVEKLAINNFRLRFLRALAPQAPLLNILRHGVEVARSITARAAVGKWYGAGDRKWAALQTHAQAVGLGDLLPLCVGPYERGLLEWRLSVEAAEEFLGPDAARQGAAPAVQLRYEELLREPVDVCRRMCAGLGLERSETMERFAVETLKRQNPAADEVAIPPTTEPIAGDLLRRLGYRF